MKTPQYLITPLLLCLLCLSGLRGQGTLQVKLDSLEGLALAEQDPKRKAELLNGLALAYLPIDANLTHQYAQEALEIAQANHWEKLLAISQKNIGAYFFSVGAVDTASHYFVLSKAGLEKTGDQVNLAKVLDHLAQIAFYSGNITEAVDCLSSSVKIYEDLNALEGLARTLANLGSVYLSMKQFDNAMSCFRQGQESAEALGDSSVIILMLGKIGIWHTEKGEYDEALTYYHKVIPFYERQGDVQALSIALTNLSESYRAKGEYHKSLKGSEKALELAQNANKLSIEAYATGNMGVAYYNSYTYYDRKDTVLQLVPGSRTFLLNKSIELFEKAVELHKQCNDFRSVMHFSEALSEAYEAADQIPNAYRYFKLYADTKDSLSSIESKTAIEKLTTERELALKDKQIELDRLAVLKKRNERVYFIIGMFLLAFGLLLLYRNYANQMRSNVQLSSLNGQLSHTLQDLRATQAQLVESEKQKENALIRSRISQDIHDDISSGLAKIAWLSETFLARTERAGVDVAPLEKINSQARDTVSKLGEIIWSSNPERDNLDGLLAYMRNHVHYYMEDAPMRWRVQFPEEVPELTISPAVRRNLYLVMKEALHNARKYSQAGEVVVDFALDGPRYRLEVRDDGQGMAPDTVQGGGNGMANMQRRMTAIGGAMHMDTAPGEGTRLVFEGELDAPRRDI